MKDTRVLAFVNPRAGSADPTAVEQALRQRFSALELVLTPEDGDLGALMRASIERVRPELLVVVGGDGTVGAGATALAAVSSPARLGILPQGTANVVARELGIPDELDAACDVLADGTPRRIDAIDYQGVRCLCRVAVGVFGEIAQSTPPEAKRLAGTLAYVFSAAPLLTQSEPQRFELEVDGVRLVTQGSCVIVTNVGEIGAGLRWGEQVRADDGRLDVFVVHSHTLPDNLDVLWNALGGDVAGSQEVSHLAATRGVWILADEALAVVADGEPSRARELRLECAPGAVEVMTPGSPAVRS